MISLKSKPFYADNNNINKLAVITLRLSAHNCQDLILVTFCVILYIKFLQCCVFSHILRFQVDMIETVCLPKEVKISNITGLARNT